MATRRQKAQVGVFLVTCILLIVCGVMLIMGLNYEPHVRYYIEFTESILGLSVGGLVEYNGVPVGTVADIVVKPRNGTAYVTIEITTAKAVLYTGVEAQLVLYSLATGTMAVQLKGGDSALGKLPPGSEITSIPSLVASISSQIGGVLENVRVVMDALNTGVAGMGEGQITAVIDQANNVLLQGEQFIHNFDESVTSVKTEINAGIKNINVTVNDIRTLVRHTDETVRVLKKKVDGLALDKLGDTTQKAVTSINSLAERLQQTAVNVEDLAKSLQGTTQNVGYNLNDTLRMLNDTLDSIQNLAQYLQRNPSGVLYGRKEATGDE